MRATRARPLRNALLTGRLLLIGQAAVSAGSPLRPALIARRIWGAMASPRRRAAAAALILALLVGALLARRAAQPALPPAIIPGQATAASIVRAIQQSEGVAVAAGGYLPGSGITLYSKIDRGDRALVRAWAAYQLGPFTERLLSLTAGERLVWIIDYPSGQQEIVQVALSQASDPTKYKFLSAAQAPPPANTTAPTRVSPSIQPQPAEEALK